MAYIGVQPADAYTSFAVQHFTTSATTSYTLDNPVANENEIALFINNVRQEPGSSYAYTASGTALTLSAATSASDTMYCVFIGKAVQTVTPANSSVTGDMMSYPLTNFSSTGIDDNATSTAITIDSSENVGIRVVPETWASNFVGLQLGNSGFLYGRSDSTDVLGLGSNVYYDGTNNKRLITGSAGRQYFNSGNIIFENASSDSADTNITFSEAMRIDSSGQVGIGATSPTDLLDVRGSIKARDASDNVGRFHTRNAFTVTNGTAVQLTSICGSAMVCVSCNTTGAGGLFWGNFSTTVSKLAGDGLTSDSGTGDIAVYKSSSSNLMYFKNRSGFSRDYVITVYAARHA